MLRWKPKNILPTADLPIRTHLVWIEKIKENAIKENSLIY